MRIELAAASPSLIYMRTNQEAVFASPDLIMRFAERNSDHVTHNEYIIDVNKKHMALRRSMRWHFRFVNQEKFLGSHGFAGVGRVLGNKESFFLGLIILQTFVKT